MTDIADATGATESPDDIVGHATFDTGEINPETGQPRRRYEPITRAEAAAIWASVEAAKADRERRMPDEQSAINALHDAWTRLKELGWQEPMYCPKDGSKFKIIELGSTGIFEGAYSGKWPNGSWDSWDNRHSYCSSIAPAMFKRFPEDQARHDQKWKEAGERMRTALANPHYPPLTDDSGG